MGWEELAMHGWEVFPLPPMRKGPPPKGATGESGENLGEKAWESASPNANVGLRLPPNIIGLDFDLYRGGGLFSSLQQRLGALPYSWGISNRENPLSEGLTVLYSIPEGLEWRGGWSNMDVIHRGLRYTLAPPSIHPSGRAYRWIHVPTGDDLIGGIPSPEEIPALPQTWVDFLTKKPAAPESDTHGLEKGFELAERDGGQMCSAMRAAMGAGLRSIRSATTSSRHDSGVKVSWRLAQLRADGHQGYTTARRAVIATFASAVSDSRGEAEAANEARALFSSAEKKIRSRFRECKCGKTQKASRRQGGVSRALFG